MSKGKGSKAGGQGIAGVSSGKGSKAGADSSGVESEEASESEDGSFAAQSLETESPLETTAPDGSFGELSTSACSLSAIIECSLGSDSKRACKDIAAPSITKCAGSKVQELRFIYTAQPCSASNTSAVDFLCADTNGGPITSPVFVSITDDMESVTFFSDTVEPGAVFGTSASSPLPDDIKIKVSKSASNEAAELLQTVMMSSSCSVGSDISLLTSYGSMQLTAFANTENGLQTAVETISQTLVISNLGTATANLSWVNMTSTLFGTSAVVSPPGVLISSGEVMSFPYESSLINLFASNQSFKSTFDVSGSASQKQCDAQASLSFGIAA